MNEDIRIRFGTAVRQKRHKLGVLRKHFADLCELDRTYIGGIERGERNVALVNIEKLQRRLGCHFRVDVGHLNLPVYTVRPDFVLRALEVTPKMTER